MIKAVVHLVLTRDGEVFSSKATRSRQHVLAAEIYS
jgi:hypothetical protein